MNSIRSIIVLILLATFSSADERLKISIAPCFIEGSNEGVLVSFENMGKDPIKIWKQQFSWGWDNMGIIVKNKNRTAYFRKLTNAFFLRNFPDYYEIKPNSSTSLKLDLFSKSWQSSDKEKIGISDADLIVVTFTVVDTPESTKYGVWTGILCGAYTKSGASKLEGK